MSSPLELIGKPIRSREAGYEQVVTGRKPKLQKIGATWIATTPTGPYAMLRWYFKDRVPVIQINERGGFWAFAIPDEFDQRPYRSLRRREPDNTNLLWAATTAIREPLERVERSWRGIVMDT